MGKSAKKREDQEQLRATAHDAALAERDERVTGPGSEALAQRAVGVGALDEKFQAGELTLGELTHGDSFQAGELTNVAADAEDSEAAQESRLTEDEAAVAATKEEHAAVTKKEEAAAAKKKEEEEKSAAAKWKEAEEEAAKKEQEAVAAQKKAEEEAVKEEEEAAAAKKKEEEEPQISALAALHVRVDERGTATVAIRALAQSGRAQGAPAAPPGKPPALAAAEAAARSWAAQVAPAAEPAELTLTVLRPGYCRGQVATMDGTGTKKERTSIVHSWASNPFSASTHTRPTHTGSERRVFFETVGAGAYCAGGNLGKVGIGDERQVFRAGRKSARGTATGRPDRNSAEEMALSVRQMGALLPVPQRCEHNAQSDMQVRVLK